MRTVSELSASTGTNHCEPLIACVAGKMPISTKLFADPTQIPKYAAVFARLIILPSDDAGS
jgi:hypothetical protein